MANLSAAKYAKTCMVVQVTMQDSGMNYDTICLETATLFDMQNSDGYNLQVSVYVDGDIIVMCNSLHIHDTLAAAKLDIALAKIQAYIACFGK